MGTQYKVSDAGRINANELGIGTTGLDFSAIVDITSTTKGFLLPRQTTAQRDAIPSPADGLLVYNSQVEELQLRANANWMSASPPLSVITHSTTWGGAFSTPIAGGDVKLYKMGRTVTAFFEDTFGTANTSSIITMTTDLTTIFRPSASIGSQVRPLFVESKSVKGNGYITITSGGVVSVGLVTPTGAFGNSGTDGFTGFYTSWISDI